MVSDQLGMQLHDRQTLGAPLTTEENAQLAAWYAHKDAAEAALLAAHPTPPANLTQLQTQVDAATEHLALSAQQLQQITVENKSLREEISQLKQQLATPRSA
jgi:septal ring factor EnvC (AmiA/AmiB activator)